MKIKLLQAVPLLVVIILCGCSSGGGSEWASNRSMKNVYGLAPVNITREDPFLIVSTEAQGAGYTSKSWGRVSHPYLFHRGEGKMTATYHFMGDKEAGGKGLASADWPAYSNDGGKTWQFGDPMIWSDGKPDHATEARRGEPGEIHYGYGWGTVKLSNGIRIGYHRDTTSGSYDERGYYRISTGVWTSDDTIWHGPFEVTFAMPHRLGNLYLSPNGVQVSDGSILVHAYGRILDEQIGGRWWSSLVLKSVDGGRSFQFLSFVGTPALCPWGDEGSSEGDLVRFPDGELVCITRTGAGGGSGMSMPMLIARSKDDGATWQREKMGLNGVNPQLQLLPNGILCLGFGRPGTYLSFSADRGKSWNRRITLGKSGVQTSGYADMVPLASNRIFVIYDQLGASATVTTPTGPRKGTINGIYGMFMTVDAN